MGKCYNFFFDSTLNSGGANNSRRLYATNWSSVLPSDKEFRVTFAFCSESDIASPIPFNTIPVIRTNLGQSSSFANLTTNSSSFSTLNALGFAKIALIASNNITATVDENYLLAEHTTNPPTYLKSRPQNSLLEVEIHIGLTGTNYIDVPDYILILHFEECDD